MTAITVTASQSGNGSFNGIMLTVKAVTGAANSPVGTTAESNTVTVPALAITPAATGSWVYGALADNDASGTFTAGASTTFSANQYDSGDDFGLATLRSTSTTTASSPVTLGGTGDSGPAGEYQIALAEIEKGAVTSLAESASSPATAYTTTAETVTTASFTPPPGSLLVAMVVSDCTGVSGDNLTLSVSDSSGLTWTLRAVASLVVGGGTMNNTAVFTARVPSALVSGYVVQAKLPGKPGLGRGRTYGNPGKPYVKLISGPVFYPRRDPARIHPVLPPRGRVAFNKGGKVKNPLSGPVFRQRVTPARAPIPKTWSKGWSRGTVIQLPWNSFFGNATLNVGITLTAGAYSAWQYIGQVPLTYLQYLMQGGTLQVTPGEYIQVAGPASGWSYELPLPPPDGRWLTTGTGGSNILGIVKLPEPEVDIFSWEPPEGQENMPIPFAVIAERIRRRQRRE